MGMKKATKINVEEIRERVEANQRARQEEIDSALNKFRKNMNERIEAEAKEKADAEAANAARLEQMRQTEFDKQYKHPALGIWKAGGGDVESFEAQWPQMRDEIRRNNAVAEIERRKRAARRQAVSGF